MQKYVPFTMLVLALLLSPAGEARAGEGENWFLFGKNSPLFKSERVEERPRQRAGFVSRHRRQPVPRSTHRRPAAYQTPSATRQAAPRQQRAGLPEKYRRQEVAYHGPHGKNTIIIDTDEKFLYLVMGNGRAMRYGIGWARPGFEWKGTHRITRKAEWPSWRPPEAMRKREPHLPAYMPGGPDNPLGARALYLGSTLYRIHGTSQPWTIGRNVSSGCIRLTNEDVIDLYNRVGVGAKVIVR